MFPSFHLFEEMPAILTHAFFSVLPLITHVFQLIPLNPACEYQKNVGGLYLNDSLGKQLTDFQSKSTVKLFFFG
jgi:hypothetical protein